MDGVIYGFVDGTLNDGMPEIEHRFGLSDAWLISVRNYIRGYFTAANSIFLLPAAQQESVKEYTERIDAYIREKLFPMLQKMAEERRVDAGCNGHSLVYRGKYFYCDYAYFKKYPFEENYENLSLITTIPAEEVIPTLVRAAKGLEDLTHCIPSDIVFQGLTNYRYVGQLMSLICKGKVDINVDDSKSKKFSCSIEIENNPYLYPVVAKLISENFHFNNIYDRPNGISAGGTILQPVINIYLMKVYVPSNCEYGIKDDNGKYYAIVPRRGEIIFDTYCFEFPTPRADSEEFNYRFNQVIYPAYIRNSESSQATD